MRVSIAMMAVLFAWGATACADAGSPPRCAGVPATAQALFDARDAPFVLALADAQRLAIGAVVPQTATDALCTGAAIAPDWVLSAKHCNVGSSVAFLIGPDRAAPLARFTAAEVVSHPQLDLMLMRLDLSHAQVPPLSPLALLDEPLDARWIGTVAQMTGYGLTEANEAGQLRFLAEAISDVTASAITLDGHGESGACSGDSGAPLLVRDREGRPRVAGILAKGSESCRGIDRYTRLDLADVRDFIAANAGALPGPALQDGCGDLDARGQCRAGDAIWCDGNEVAFERCADDAPCGWDAKRKGYRCLPAAQDACAGINQDGACVQSVATRCRDGRVVRADCSACMQHCGRDPSRGFATCRP